MLSIRGITKTFKNNPVLRGVDLDIASGELVCLLGPSGCGKTTLLRIVAGLETADTGDVKLNGTSILDIPVHRRDFGLMFQDFALFPHLNVAQNIAFGLKMRNLAAHEQTKRIREVLELVSLSDFERRDVAQLSGGERQRVALARSLAPNPRLLMLDEPLGSLDAALRERLVIDLRDVIKRIGLTAIYVTHDQHEAFAIADRIALMNAGRFEQIDTPQSLYQHPQTTFAAQFLGLNNIVPIQSRRNGHAFTPLGDFPISGEADSLLLHPDGIEATSEGTISGTVEEGVFQGDAYRVVLRHRSGMMLTFRLPTRKNALPRPGETLNVRIDPAFVLPLQKTIAPMPKGT
jgi:ABC-type Fe3+/spermidine/putrescine transport system ATPase subunit